MASALVEELAPAAESGVTSTETPNFSIGPRWLPPLVLIGAIALSVWVYAFFWQNSRALWWWINHDRHTHYMYGLDLALDVRSGDLTRLAHDFDRIRVWGPLHPVLVALVELVGGPDHRLAVLPSLAGFVMTIWFAFLIPRRLLSSGGNAAGLLAAFLVAVSPAHRAFATDVMYESLGAGLSLAALYCYLVVVQERSPRWGLALAATLTILFVHKYNYWLLVVMGLVVGEFARQPNAWLQFARSVCRRDRLPAWLVNELKHPLNWLAVAFGLAAIAVLVTGGGAIGFAGREILVQQPHNLIHLAYVALFARLCLWWWKIGRGWSTRWPDEVRNVVFWHGGAVAAWFVLPKRLSYFFWYLSPTTTDQHRDSVPFMHGLPTYIQGLRDDYFALSWGVFLFAGMLLLGLLACRKLRPGSAALFCFFLIAAYLTCQHPMLKNRFMHSWIAVGFIIGAVGLVQTAQTLAGFVAPSWQRWAAPGVCALVVGLTSPAFLEPGHAQEGGIKTSTPTALVVPETYLADLADADHPTIFCNVSTRFLLTWTFIERYHHRKFTADIKNYKANFENNPEKIRRWLAETRSDTLVIIDVLPGSVFHFRTDEYVDLSALREVLTQQTVFSARKRWERPEGFIVTLWKKS